MLTNFEILTDDSLPSLMTRSEAEASIAGFDSRITAIENVESGLETWAAGVNTHLDNLDINKADNIHTHTWASITNKPTLFSGAYNDLTGKPTLFSGNYNDLTNKPTIPSSTTRAGLGFVAAASNISDSVANAPVNAATNAPTNSKTDYNVLTTLLGTLTDGLNTTNTAQNTIAGIVNANATKQNAGFAILNTLAGKFNLSLDILENNGLMSA